VQIINDVNDKNRKPTAVLGINDVNDKNKDKEPPAMPGKK
jgi:hypothetical protein